MSILDIQKIRGIPSSVRPANMSNLTEEQMNAEWY